MVDPESGVRGELMTLSLLEKVGLGVESRALPVYTLLSSLLILLFGDPHLLEGSLEDTDNVLTKFQ